MNTIKQKCFFLLFFLFPFLTLSAESTARSAEMNFDRILLIINFNHPFYNNIPFLNKIYSGAFPNIVYYGEKQDDHVIQMLHHKGYWGHKVITDAMERYPDFEGYLCVQDDCFMNFWNFSRFDKNKIWANSIDTINIKVKRLHRWHWWNLPFGKKATFIALSKFSEKHRSKLTQNLGRDHIAYGCHDFVYIPARLKDDFIEVSKHFTNPNVFVEIAVPTILCAIDDMQNWEHCHFIWGLRKLDDYDLKYDWLHPIKFSNVDNQNFILNIISNYEYQ